MEYLITAYPSTPTPAMILTPPARAYSPSPSPSPALEPEQEPIASTSQLQPIASTSQLPPAPSTSRRVLDHILLPRLPAGWLSAPPAARASEPVQDAKACHQCRNLKNLHARYHCGRAGCVRAYCTSCLAKRYAWAPADIHVGGCPGCRGVCNCSQCLDRAGLGRHKAFLTADARAGGCARKWLAERGLLVEGDGPPPTVAQRKKNMAKRPKILAKKQTDEVAPKRRVKKTQPQQVDYDEYNCDYDEEDKDARRGRWIIDASAKLVKRWARERAVRGAQVRAGTRRWFVGASPPPRPRARDDAPPVETIDLTLDDDDDAPDSLFDAKSTDGDAQPARDKTEDADEKIADDLRGPDSPDSLFDEKSEDEDAPAQDEAADDKDDAPAPAPAQNAAPDDKDDDDTDSLFDGDPGTPAAAAPSPPQIAPEPVQLPSTPPQLPPTPTPIQLPPSPVQLPPTPIQLPLPPTPSQLPPTPFHLPPTPTQLPPTSIQVHLPPTPTPLQLPPTSPILSLSRSDSYTDALRIDVELAVPSSPAKDPSGVEVHITFGDAFGGATASPTSPVVVRSPATVDPVRSPVTSHVARGPAPASPVTAGAPIIIDSTLPLASPSTGPAPTWPVAPSLPLAPPPKSPPKTSSKAASAMFIPRAKPVAKRKRDSEERKRADDGDERRLDAAKSSAGVLVALGRPGRVTRAREEAQHDAEGREDGVQVQVEATDQKDKDDAQARMDDVQVQQAGATNDKDDAPMHQDDVLLKKDGGPAQKDGAPTHKRPREDDAPALDDARPAKRAALSKETVRKPGPDTRLSSLERKDDYDVDDNPVEVAAPSKETARKPPRASSSRHEDATIVDGLPTPKPTVTKHSAADALAQAMRAAYGGGGATSDPTPAPVASSSSAPVASSSSARDSKLDSRATVKKGSKPTVLAQRAAAQASGSSSSLAIALKTPASSAASALAAAYKQAYAAARAPSPASTLRSSPTPEPPAPTLESGKPALHDELSTFIGRFDKDDEEPTPELLPSDLAAQSEGSSRTGPVSPLVAAHRRPPIVVEDTDEEEMPQRRPFVPCNPRRFVGMPLRFVPAPKRPRPVKRAVIDLDTDDEYKDDDEDDFGLARRRKRTKLWEQSAVVLQQQEAIVVLDDSDDSDFQPAPALVKKSAGSGKGKGKSKSFGPGKGKTKPRKLPLSTFIAYSYTPPPTEPETMPEPVFVPDDDTAAAPPASEVWLGAAMAPLSPDLGLTRAVADAWFSAV